MANTSNQSGHQAMRAESSELLSCAPIRAEVRKTSLGNASPELVVGIPRDFEDDVAHAAIAQLMESVRLGLAVSERGRWKVRHDESEMVEHRVVLELAGASDEEAECAAGVLRSVAAYWAARGCGAIRARNPEGGAQGAAQPAHDPDNGGSDGLGGCTTQIRAGRSEDNTRQVEIEFGGRVRHRLVRVALLRLAATLEEARPDEEGWFIEMGEFYGRESGWYGRLTVGMAGHTDEEIHRALDWARTIVR